MKAKEIRAYQSTIRNGHPADIEYYRNVMAGCEEYPFEGAGSTALSRAIWLDMKGKLALKPMNPIKAYIQARGWNAKTMATAAGVKLNTLYKIMSERCGGPVERKVLAYIAANPVDGKVVVPVDLRDWRQAVRKLDGLIDSGKVRSVEIRLEVGA